MAMITLKEIKEYVRIDIEEDDPLLHVMIAAAEEYLKNATEKDYPETDENGNKINYELEKIYLSLLVAYLYEKRTPEGKGISAQDIPENFSFMAKSIMLQLQLK